MKRAAIYARSSLRNDQVYAQVEACRAFAESHGYAVVATYLESGGGSVFRQMLSDAGSFDAVIAWSADRLSRDRNEAEARIAAMEVSEVEPVFVKALIG